MNDFKVKTVCFKDGRTVRHILTSGRTSSLWNDEIDILVALVKDIHVNIIGVQEHCNYLFRD